ncbi:DUF4190 domain-containing protein [Actinomadura chokoriensis]|uniref:DUF4190 domain-containing protein n=1 Tax=Actinomadura chokoriensis TaxID=454156 RepID=A0ABV4R7W9_9ACTN
MSTPGGVYGGGAPPPYGEPRGGPRPQGTNSLAVASLILGILWLGWIGSILAIVFGHVSLSQIKRTGQAGKGMAIAGLVLGYLGLVIGVIVVTLLVALFNDTGEKQTRVVLEADGSGGAAHADITYSFTEESAQANDRSLPWRKKESRKVGGFDVLVLDVQNTGERGSVTCRIRVNGKVVTNNTSVGPFAVASCSYNRLGN